MTSLLESNVLGALPVIAQLSPPSAKRAERAQLKSRRDDMIVAQGKRGTSAALPFEFVTLI